MNKVLMNAILSMDSYNRGYDAAITLHGNMIGSATILTTTLNGVEVNLDSQIIIDPMTGERKDDDIGFYALAYAYDKDADGVSDETIISYRGTDYPVTEPKSLRLSSASAERPYQSSSSRMTHFYG